MAFLIPIAIAAATYGVWTIPFWLTVAAVAVGQWQAANARRQARDAFNASLRDRLVSVSITTAMRSRVYGRARNVDCVLYKATHGADLRYYTFVVAVAGHEVDAIETCYFNDKPIALDGSGYVLTAPYVRDDTRQYSTSVTIAGGVGSVTLPKTPKPGTIAGGIPQGGGAVVVGPDAIYDLITVTSIVGNVVNVACASNGTADLTWLSTETIPLARVLFFNGAPGQDLSASLIALGVPGIVAGVHRFAGFACMIVSLTYDLEAYTTGVPQMSAVLRGAKCFDRRTSTTAWTENPAVIADDWSQYAQGGALASGEIAASSIIASANACDVTHNFAYSTIAGATQFSVLPIYTCGIVCKTGADPADTLSAIVESMAGQWGWASGKLRIKAGYYSAPVLTIDESWFSAGDRQFSQSLPQNELVNVYNPEIADKTQGYIVVPTASVRAAAYITSDGRELPRSITLEGVTDVVHAQHVCGVMLRQSRQGFTAQLPCNFKGIQPELFDTVSVTLERYGLAAKPMDVVDWRLTQEGGTTLVLKETAASIFDPDAEFTLLDASPNTNLPLPWVVPQVTGVVVLSGTALLSDRSIVTRTRVSWNTVPSAAVLQSGKVEIAYLDLTTGEQTWQTVQENGDATETIITGLRAGRMYQFRVRGVTTLGVRGPWSATVTAIIAPTYFDDALDATTDIALVARGQCVVTGNRAEKVGGILAWDSDVYSRDFAYGACMTSAMVPVAAPRVMFGLNSDPTTNSSYTSLDYSWFWSGSDLNIYEGGALISGGWTLAADSVLTIVYDGSVVRYLQNGVTRRTVVAAPGQVFFFDSSFFDPGSVLENIRFAALSANDWASIGGVNVTTGQIAANAATEVYEDTHDFAGASFGTGIHRTINVTPVSSCTIEFTGNIIATNVYPDAANYLWWSVTAGAGSPVVVGDCPPVNGLNRQQFSFVKTFAAVGGVALAFELNAIKNISNPSIILGVSSLRITQVKR